ncbi:TetR/AcrR family transcriptional regulator C-terminal domain-containing protein [Nocardioides sp. Kera G14]|uniref:TetR/AcrR family transcriptional regulator C-terminal domain-containing protein n=1 Tax=Nocardioides sp. Kera G14 TaxID=2884264 RepID=UPI001D10E9F5|nr:TetR/AcrR family transcriptional regulator C-terminal domain-containing protein [Nocardioides sp. Kera G14]UDY22707.1 TetR/AcrR family transcriptional regulator C-terminal domain-containing protein [Nocardioides sp. Kera G14]
MRYRRSDVIDRALLLLDAVGLPELSMRRLGADLGVQPSALYHHVPNKQTLLALMADELLARATWPEVAAWEEQVASICWTLDEVLLSWRDGAELAATAWSFGLGAQAPYDLLLTTLEEGGFGKLGPTAARTLLHYVYGHAVDEQTHRQAAAAGAIDAGQREDDFGTGLAMIIAGIQVVHAARS